jgi:4-amino-4-deoxy-L-arabinose transferase-like glycosyltransferase
MLLTLPWIGKRDARFLVPAAAFLGLAVLAKSSPPVALTIPLLWFGWRSGLPATRWIKMALAFLVIAVPWHVLCYARNGRIFPETLFVQQQLVRYTAGVMHPEPWWFYLPVFAGLLLPWTPLLPLVPRMRATFRDPRRQALLAVVLFGLLFFSIAPNKLPAYVLPLVPAAAILMALAVDQAIDAAGWLSACAVLLVSLAVAAPILPAAVANGLSRAPRPPFHWTWLVPILVAAATWTLDRKGWRLAAALCVAAASAGGMIYLKRGVAPELDRVASARSLWGQVQPHAAETCIAASVKRDFRYGLNYYAESPLPDCTRDPRMFRITQTPGMPPAIETSPGPNGPVDPH